MNENQKLLTYLGAITDAKHPADLLNAWLNTEGSLKNYFSIVSLPEYNKSVLPNSLIELINDPNNVFVPYFNSDNLLFLDNQIINEMTSGKSVNVEFDYSIMFDSNFASYIHKFINGINLGSLTNLVYEIIDKLLKGGFNYDFWFYIVENSKNILKKNGEENSDLLDNLISLELFRNIDSKDYLNKGILNYTISLEEAKDSAKSLMNDVYFSNSGKEFCDNIVLQQKACLLLLIGILKIEFGSKMGVKKKMNQYFQYIDETVGVYMDRESIVAHKYFEDRKNVKMLLSINKGGKQNSLFEKLNNIAWDFIIPRFMERMLRAGQGRGLIPIFLSFDVKLIELLNMYSVKGVVFNMEGPEFIPVPNTNSYEYYQNHGMKLDFEHFQDRINFENRRQVFLENCHNEFSIIDKEFEELLSIMEN
ncbi:hypothetical protein [Paenibacillus sp. USHLN196]|uniref:hypothetical protein n=1 Tax=Paenibacillus sp. USHLN196 TaxID=3081291 RepID=UPI00301A2703